MHRRPAQYQRYIQPQPLGRLELGRSKQQVGYGRTTGKKSTQQAQWGTKKRYSPLLCPSRRDTYATIEGRCTPE